MNNYDKLSPLAIINNPSLIRVPVTMNPNNGDIVVFVGDAHIRIYNDQTLPDHLKASLVQIRTTQIGIELGSFTRDIFHHRLTNTRIIQKSLNLVFNHLHFTHRIYLLLELEGVAYAVVYSVQNYRPDGGASHGPH